MSEANPQLENAANKLGIGSYLRHVLLCIGPNCCSPEEGQRGEAACYRTKVGCLRICCQGPILVVYPEGTWYHGMKAEQIPSFVQEHLIKGQPIEGLIFARNPITTNDGNS
jgi:(2Fe-2S) ferredoxin